MSLPDDHKQKLWDKKHPPSQRAKVTELKPVDMSGGLKVGSCPPIPKKSADRISRIAEETRKGIEKC